jgi:hypothetical protein
MRSAASSFPRMGWFSSSSVPRRGSSSRIRVGYRTCPSIGSSSRSRSAWMANCGLPTNARSVIRIPGHIDECWRVEGRGASHEFVVQQPQVDDPSAHRPTEHDRDRRDPGVPRHPLVGARPPWPDRPVHQATPSHRGQYGGRERSVPRADVQWALRDSNPRPSPCKGDALPAELSARTTTIGMPAGSAHHVSQSDRQTGRPASRAPVEALLPIGPVVLAVGTDQDLDSPGHRARPRNLTLVGIEGRAVTKEAARPVRRPHGPEGYPFRAGEATGCRLNHAVGVGLENRSVSTASSTMVLFSS